MAQLTLKSLPSIQLKLAKCLRSYQHHNLLQLQLETKHFQGERLDLGNEATGLLDGFLLGKLHWVLRVGLLGEGLQICDFTLDTIELLHKSLHIAENVVKLFNILRVVLCLSLQQTLRLLRYDVREFEALDYFFLRLVKTLLEVAKPEVSSMDQLINVFLCVVTIAQAVKWRPQG